MKRKIDLFWYWFIFVIAFVFCFYCSNSNNVNAYFLNDEGNIQSDNVVYIGSNDRVYSGIRAISSSSSNSVSLVGISTNEVSFSYLGSNGAYSITKYWQNFTVSLDNSIYINAGTYILDCEGVVNNNILFMVGDLGTRFDSGRRVYRGVSFTIDEPKYFYATSYFNVGSNVNINFSYIALYRSSSLPSSFEPFGTWYNESIVGDLSQGVIGIESAFLTYEDGGTGDTVNYGDVSSLIKNTFGTLYFDEVWKMLDNYAVDGYENAFIDIKFKDRFDITTKYIITTSKDNYGSGVIFYQDNVEMLSVLNLFNVKDQYCGGSPSYSCYVQLNNYVNVVQEGVNSSNAFSYLNRIKVWSDSVDMQTLTFGFENISYSQGYNSGYNVGYGVGNSYGQGVGYNQGYNQGYLYGYEKGVDAVEGTDNTLVGLVGGILTAPVNMLQTIFDFEFLGINLTHFIFSLVSLFIVIWLIKIFL